MPLSVLLYEVSLLLIISSLATRFGLRTPVRLSSLASGEQARPGLFTIVEDVVAVDGGQGDTFRELWDARYKKSEEMRSLLANLSWIWGLSGLVMAIVVTVLVFTINVDAAWAIGTLY